MKWTSSHKKKKNCGGVLGHGIQYSVCQLLMIYTTCDRIKENNMSISKVGKAIEKPKIAGNPVIQKYLLTRILPLVKFSSN